MLRFRRIKLFDEILFCNANLWGIELNRGGKFRMNFRMNPVSIMGASPLAYICLRKKVVLVTRKFFLGLLSSNFLPPASIDRQLTHPLAVFGILRFGRMIFVYFI